MSATSTRPGLDLSQATSVPLRRLVAVELRKLTDTLAGRWLLAITVGILALVAGIILVVALFNDSVTLTLADWQGVFGFLMSLLLPVVAITSITQEWSQRTGLVTFSLEPRRPRVVISKLLAVITLAAMTVAIAAVLALVAHVALSAIVGSDDFWTIDTADLGWSLVTQLFYFLMAFGLGMVLLNTPAAVVIYYVVALMLPQMVWGIVYFMVSWGPQVIPWFDFSFAVGAYRGQLPPTMDGTTPDLGIGPVISSAVLWVVVPFVFGLWRILRVELK